MEFSCFRRGCFLGSDFSGQNDIAGAVLYVTDVNDLVAGQKNALGTGFNKVIGGLEIFYRGFGPVGDHRFYCRRSL